MNNREIDKLIAELAERVENLGHKIRMCENELAQAWLVNQRYLAVAEREEVLKLAAAQADRESWRRSFPTMSDGLLDMLIDEIKAERLGGG